MATLNGITLKIGDGSPTTVTVSGAISFDASDVGRTYRMGISLWGQDEPGDKLPATDSVGDDELYRFEWGLRRQYLDVRVVAAGTRRFQETRKIDSAALDEDAGLERSKSHPELYVPVQDEVYARVTLSVPSVVAPSNTVKVRR